MVVLYIECPGSVELPGSAQPKGGEINGLFSEKRLSESFVIHSDIRVSFAGIKISFTVFPSIAGGVFDRGAVTAVLPAAGAHGSEGPCGG